MIIECRTVSEFITINGDAFSRLMRYMFPAPEDVLQDRMQTFYLNMCKYKTLHVYDKSKCSFLAYIINTYKWSLPKKQIPAHVNILDHDQPVFDDTLQMRLDDYRRYLKLKGCENLSAILAELDRRINDQPVKDSASNTILRTISKQFLEDENV